MFHKKKNKEAKIRLNKKGFSLVEILFAVGLLALATIAIGAIIISTQNNTAQMFNESELQQQLVEAQETLHNEILSTNAGIKCWVRETSANSLSLSLSSNENTVEKVIAFYKVDTQDGAITKTYYRWTSEKKTLEVATLKQSIPENTRTFEVDTNIGTTLASISNWTIMAVNLQEFSVDLSDHSKNKLVSYALKIEFDGVCYPTNDVIYLRNDIAINGALTVDMITSMTLEKPILTSTSFEYDGYEHSPTENGYVERYMIRSSVSKTSAIDVGTYTIIYRLKNKVATKWADGTTEDVVRTWTIVATEDYDSGIIPDGATYTLASDGTVLVAGQPFPKVVADGDVYTYKDYFYTYQTSSSGWKVSVIDASKTSYGEILGTVNGKAIVSMAQTFYNCESLKLAPEIPNTVKNMNGTFSGCTELTTMSKIHASVTDMKSTFQNCSKLEGIITIDANPTSYDGCFKNTAKDIYLTGASTKLYMLAKTDNNDNVSVLNDDNNNIIPEGGIYLVGGYYEWEEDCDMPYFVYGKTVYEAGDEFPAIQDGDVYRYGDYQYVYGYAYDSDCESFTNRIENGWSVYCMKNEMIESSEILESINTKPVINMDWTFLDCDSLTTVPNIPISVTSMVGTFSNCQKLTTAPILPEGLKDIGGMFYGCLSLKTYVGAPEGALDGDFSGYIIPSSVTNMVYYSSFFDSDEGTFAYCKLLTSAPIIPSGVTNMHSTFMGCIALEGMITINANPTSYGNCFKDTVLPIYLTGTSDVLCELAQTDNNNNVNVYH